MRFGLVHRIMTDALAALGIFAIIASASLSPWSAAFALGGLVTSITLPESVHAHPWYKHLGTAGPLILVLVAGSQLVLGAPALDVAIEFATFLQILRMLTRRGAAHDQQIIVLALLHFVVGTVLGGGIAFGLCFLGFMVVAPGALALSHLRREVEGNYRQGARDRTGLPVDVPRILRSRRVVGRDFLVAMCSLSVPVFLFTALLFVMFPRVGLSLLLVNHQRPGRMVGFSDRVDLGNVGVLRTDPTVALRFEVPGQQDPPERLTLRLRGTAFDQYNGRSWSRSSTERKPESRVFPTFLISRLPRPGDQRLLFDVEPIDPPVLFFPPRAVAFELKLPRDPMNLDTVPILRGPENEFRYGGGQETRGLRYEVTIAPESEPAPSLVLPAGERARYLTMPPGTDTRIAELAASWTAGITSPYLRAKAIEQQLARDYQYDTNSPSGGTDQPVDDFLFESRRGHCEFFSTAMALMLRTQGIPTRNVTGFVGGTYNRFGRYYAVREGDAHSWIEAFIEPEGGTDGTGAWLTFDPTPTAAAQPLESRSGAWVYTRDFFEAMQQRWSRYVVGYDLNTQSHMLNGVRQRYQHFRSKNGLDQGKLGTLTRPRWLAGATVVSLIVVYVVWRRRKRPGEADKDAGKQATKSAGPPLSTRLYESLEAVLRSQGLHRPPATTPSRYAGELQTQGHALAGEVEELTAVYLATRFGGEALDDEATASFFARVNALRKRRPE